MCEKAVGDYPFTFEFIPNCYKTQEMWKKSVSGYPLMLKYCPNKYKT